MRCGGECSERDLVRGWSAFALWCPDDDDYAFVAAQDDSGWCPPSGSGRLLPCDAYRGLVNGRRDGRCVYYRVDPRGMKPRLDWIAHYRAFWTERVGRLERLLEKMDR